LPARKEKSALRRSSRPAQRGFAVSATYAKIKVDKLELQDKLKQIHTENGD
jgi:hypothetical protein